MVDWISDIMADMEVSILIRLLLYLDEYNVNYTTYRQFVSSRFDSKIICFSMFLL